jgi:PAS domain S-box-containing protein
MKDEKKTKAELIEDLGQLRRVARELREANAKLRGEAAERTRAEEKKKYFNEFTENIIESTQVGIYALDKDGMVKIWNQGMERQFGVDSGDIEGKNVFEAFPVLAQEPLGAALKKTLEEGEPFEQNRVRHQTLKRGERILNTKINALHNPSGGIVGAVVITEDVTERVKAGEALRESEERYRSLVEAIHGGFAIVDGDENILFVNQAYCDMLGYVKEELTGMNVSELVAEGEFLRMKKATEKKLRSKEPTKYETVMRRKDGSERRFLVSSTPFFDDGGNYKYTLGVALDITDHKRTEAELKIRTRQLEEAHRRADELLRNILPEQVIEELEEIETPLPRSVPNVTIAFIDIVGFSDIAARVSHKALVTKLAAYFHAFDLIVKDHGLEKLKTVGDGYMYAGGLFAENNQLGACAEAALDILKIVGKRDWQVRIGIHVGPCIAGLIKGWRMVYDVWGDTVNVAARLQEGCEPGCINVSEEVYEELGPRFDFEYRGELPLYTLGPTPMYYLKGMKSS